jgi:hypothetical protein
MKSSHLGGRIALLLIFFVGLNAVAQTLPPATGVTHSSAAATQSPWERIVLIGASVSGGFTESEPFGGPKTARYRLSHYINAALIVPHEPVLNFGTPLFFVAPETDGRRQIEAALKEKPTLVIGTDFLFWYCYGLISTDEERLQLFERGLKLLERVGCPLVLGNIPDASGAANRMLSEEEIPNAKVLAAANRRLKEWAATRPQVMVLDVSSFMRAAMSNKAFTVRDQTWPQGKTRSLLQADHLHPTGSGCAALALAVMDTLVSRHPAYPADAVRWDAADVLRLGLMAAQKTEKPAPPAAAVSSDGK